MPNLTESELRSEEVQEILTRIPPWIIRWGNIVVLLLVLLVLLISWFVKYPDIVTADIIITTRTPPEKLIARVSGRIESVLVTDQQKVLRSAPLAVIENAADYRHVFLLKSITDTIDPETRTFPFHLLKGAQLGEVENSFAVFRKEFIADELNSKLQPYRVENNAYSYEAMQLKERILLLESQKDISQRELQIQKVDLDRYEKLFQKGIIAAQEIEKQRLLYLQAEKNYNNMLSSVSQMKSALNELKRTSQGNQISETREHITLERNVIQAFYELKRAIKNWEMNYVLRSSMDGEVTFLQIWSANQSVTAGDNVFAIIPDNDSAYIGKAKALAQNSGKIRTGQRVNIRLANYPDSEFGVVVGEVSALSLTPDKDGKLLIDVVLPEGLLTSYNKKISFQQEMSGTAEVITEDLRLIERLLYQFRDVFSRG